MAATCLPGRWLQGLSLGWKHHRGKIYFSVEWKPWEEAEAACRSTRSHLTSTTSLEEQDYLAREARGGSYWIGLVATGPGGSWRWVDRAAYFQAQSFWAPGQPDRTDYGPWGQESCAQIHPVGNGLWNDHNCNFTFPWICKRGPECDLTPATLPAPHSTPPCQMSPPGDPLSPLGQGSSQASPHAMPPLPPVLRTLAPSCGTEPFAQL